MSPSHRGQWWVFVALAVCQASGHVAYAGQQTSESPALRDPRSIVFEHDGKDVLGFALYVQPASGSAIRIDLGPLRPDAKGVVTAAIPHLPAGLYRAEIAAYNGGGESPRVPADPPLFSISTPAAAPASTVTDPRAAEPKTSEPSKPLAANPPKKEPIGKRFWKVIVGDDDKP
jgi:hypothetical protein